MSSSPLESDGFLTPGEERGIADVITRVRANPYAVSAGLEEAFLLYQRVMQRKLREQPRLDTDQSTEAQLVNSLRHLALGFGPWWSKMTSPLLFSGYLVGVRDSGILLPKDLLQETANQYSLQLGTYIHENTAKAVVDGYRSQVNRKVAFRQAYDNAIGAFGVNPRTMNALVNVWGSEEPKRFTTTRAASVKEQRAQHLIDAALKQRAKLIGEQESWNAKEQAKQMSWTYAQRTGVIPETSVRQWMTAKDELVCPQCGPMHKKRAKVGEKFSTPLGDVWSPPMHVNCRCEAVLKTNVFRTITRGLISNATQVEKAYEGRPWARYQHRNEEGEWVRGAGAHKLAVADQPQAPPPPTKEKKQEFDIARLVREAEQRMEKPPPPEMNWSAMAAGAPSAVAPSAGMNWEAMATPTAAVVPQAAPPSTGMNWEAMAAPPAQEPAPPQAAPAEAINWAAMSATPAAAPATMNWAGMAEATHTATQVHPTELSYDEIQDLVGLMPDASKEKPVEELVDEEAFNEADEDEFAEEDADWDEDFEFDEHDLARNSSEDRPAKVFQPIGRPMYAMLTDLDEVYGGDGTWDPNGKAFNNDMDDWREQRKNHVTGYVNTWIADQFEANGGRNRVPAFPIGGHEYYIDRTNLHNAFDWIRAKQEREASVETGGVYGPPDYKVDQKLTLYVRGEGEQMVFMTAAGVVDGMHLDDVLYEAEPFMMEANSFDQDNFDHNVIDASNDLEEYELRGKHTVNLVDEPVVDKDGRVITFRHYKIEPLEYDDPE